MRILVDENFPALSVQELKKLGHDVLWVRTVMPGAGDDIILERAQNEERILVTLDKDFGELAFGRQLPADCGVVLFRMKMTDAKASAAKMARLLNSRSDWIGNFAVVEDDRIRMRPLATNILTSIT